MYSNLHCTVTVQILRAVSFCEITVHAAVDAEPGKGKGCATRTDEGPGHPAATWYAERDKSWRRWPVWPPSRSFPWQLCWFSRRKKRRRRQHRAYLQVKYKRPALLRPSREVEVTPWQKNLSSGDDGEFLATKSLSRSVVLDVLLPAFHAQRLAVNFGSPFRRGPKTRGRKPLLNSVDILCLTLKYLRSPAFMYECCPFFGITPSTASEWIDYGLCVLLKVVTGNAIPECEIKWPSPTQMKESARLLKKNRR